MSDRLIRYAIGECLCWKCKCSKCEKPINQKDPCGVLLKPERSYLLCKECCDKWEGQNK